MSDPWINRLEVSGPERDVEAFSRAATPGRRPAKAGLSFKVLRTRLAKKASSVPASEITDPYGVTADPPEILADGMARRCYHFEQCRYDPVELLVDASLVYPSLCIVLGWVAPATDEIRSELIRAGKTRQFDLPQSRREELYCSGGDEDEVDLEADWTALDEVVTHWRAEVQRILKKIARDFPRPPRETSKNAFPQPVHYSRTDSAGWKIYDWETASRLLGHLDPDYRYFAIFQLPDGSYAQCLGSKWALTLEIREVHSKRDFTHWVVGKGPLTGRTRAVRGDQVAVEVDSSQVLSLKDARAVIQQFLQFRSFPETYTRTDVTSRFRRGKKARSA